MAISSQDADKFRLKHAPAVSQRSLQACIASLPLQSSWMSKTYLKSDHFNGGGSSPIVVLQKPSSLLIEHDGLIHFEERPLDRRLRQSVPLQYLIIEPHQHFEL
jgi:hypothetical protein